MEQLERDEDIALDTFNLKIMDATPVEQLSGVSLGPSDLQPPVGAHSEPFHELSRQRIRWQLGL